MMRLSNLVLCMLLAIGSLTVSARVLGAERLKLLIVDGQNNHEWQVTTPIMQRYFQESGRHV